MIRILNFNHCEISAVESNRRLKLSMEKCEVAMKVEVFFYAVVVEMCVR